MCVVGGTKSLLGNIKCNVSNKNSYSMGKWINGFNT